MTTVSIILVSYNVKSFLEQCLYSIFASTGVALEVIVVDNHSIDGTVPYLRPMFPQVIFLEQTENPGFAIACNVGLKKASGDYVLFLNPDTIVSDDTLLKCIRCFEQDQNIGAVGVRMINGEGIYLKESKRGFPSAWASFCKVTGLIKLFPNSRFFAGYYMGHLNSLNSQYVEILSGAFMMLPMQLATSLQGFDPSYFMYGEDIDLSYRISKTVNPATLSLYRNYYYAATTIIHYKGESTNKSSVKYIQRFYEAMSIFVQKHYKGISGRVLNFFLQSAILLKKIAAYVTLFLVRFFAKGPRSKPDVSICIVGNIQETENCKQVIEANAIPIRFISQISVEMPVDELKNDLKKRKESGEKIIFCIGILTYNQIIRITDDIKPLQPIAVFAPASKSVAF